MFANRISDYIEASSDPQATAAPVIPSGFAVCQLAPAATQPLALQLIAQQQAYQAQQQAYEKALLAAREDALRLVLSMLKPSVN